MVFVYAVPANGERMPLALLKTTRVGLPQLDWAPEDARARTAGKRVYAVSGFGGQGATASPGLAVDASAPGADEFDEAPASPITRRT